MRESTYCGGLHDNWKERANLRSASRPDFLPIEFCLAFPIGGGQRYMTNLRPALWSDRAL